jgi:hypothetical protein
LLSRGVFSFHVLFLEDSGRYQTAHSAIEAIWWVWWCQYEIIAVARHYVCRELFLRLLVDINSSSYLNPTGDIKSDEGREEQSRSTLVIEIHVA